MQHVSQQQPWINDTLGIAGTQSLCWSFACQKLLPCSFILGNNIQVSLRRAVLRLVFSVAFCSPAKSLAFSGLMENPLVGKKLKS